MANEPGSYATCAWFSGWFDVQDFTKGITMRHMANGALENGSFEQCLFADKTSNIFDRNPGNFAERFVG